MSVNKLSIRETITKQSFLIDTGADVSVVPWNSNLLIKPCSTRIFAADGSRIETRGATKIELDFGFRKKFLWEFIVARVNSPIIGADFIRNFNLIIDMNKGTLQNGCTKQIIKCEEHMGPPLHVKAFACSSPISRILEDFPEVTGRAPLQRTVISKVKHKICTSRQPVFAKPRRLDPTKLREAKREFEEMLKQGICRPSSSNWSSPLHMVPKEDGSFRPCGDFRALNAQTIPDRYPLPFIQDVSAILDGKRVFSKVDLKKAFHQVPIDERDIHKTAIITPFGLFEFPYMTFGLCNAAQTFQRLIDHVLKGLNFVFPYVDDILIASTDEAQHR